MKLIGVRLINFRCFQDSGRISIRDLTAFVGANDIGKSSVLEALDIFFNEKKANVPISIDDLNVVARTLPTADVEIRCFFSDSDSSASTEMDGELPLSLKEEELVNENGELEMGKRYRFKEGKLLSLTPEKCFRVARRQVVVTKEGAKGPGLLSLSDKDLCEVCRENGRNWFATNGVLPPRSSWT